MELTTDPPASTSLAESSEGLVPTFAGDTSHRVDGFWLGFVGIVPLVGLLPMICVELIRLWGIPHYRFFPLTLLGFAAVLILNFRGALPDQRRLQIGAISVVIGCVLGLLAIVFFRPAIAHLAAAFLLFGWLAGQLGETRLSRILAMVFLFATTIPLLGGWDLSLLRSLQVIAADWASGALDAVGILNLQSEATIASRYFVIPVSRVGGGPDSVFFLLSLAAFLIATRRHGVASTVISLALVPLWFLVYAVLCNVVLAMYADSAEQSGATLPFVAVRVTCLAVVCVAIAAFDIAIVALLRTDHASSAEDQWLLDEETLTGSLAVIDSSRIPICRYAAAPLSAVLLLAGISAAVLIALNLPRAIGSSGGSVARASQVADADPLPKEISGWRQVGFTSTFAREGGGMVPIYEWKYTRGIEAVTFSLQGITTGFDAVAILARQGWRVADTDSDLTSDDSAGLKPVRMQNAAGEQAFLLRADIAANGAIVPPAAASGESGHWQTIFKKLSASSQQSTSDTLAVRLLHTSVVKKSTLDPQVAELFTTLTRGVAGALGQTPPPDA